MALGGETDTEEWNRSDIPEAHHGFWLNWLNDKENISLGKERIIQ